MTQRPRGPVIFDLEGEAPNPAEAPPVLDTPEGGPAAMQTAALLASRPRSRLGRLFWTALLSLLGLILSLAAWDFVTGLLSRNEALGWIAFALTAAVVLTALALAAREAAGFARLKRLDQLRAGADAALADRDIKRAHATLDGLVALYSDRPDLAWARSRLAERRGEIMDADTLLALAEADLMAPLDQAARREVEAAARQVAAVTALVPLALADVAAALLSNMRMIRRIAEIYGGRAGTLGAWRLTRSVLTHLVATGAVAVGDDMISSFAGGGILSKVSRRFGEGVVNGALTARVGVAAIEVCRPLPFRTLPRPRVTNLMSRALTGLFPGTG